MNLTVKREFKWLDKGKPHVVTAVAVSEQFYTER